MALYKRSYTFLYPSYFFLSLAFVAMEKGWEQFILRLAQPEVIFRLTIVAIVFVVGAMYLSNWYMKKLYGNHLDKLKSLLNDLQESNA